MIAWALVGALVVVVAVLVVALLRARADRVPVDLVVPAEAYRILLRGLAESGASAVLLLKATYPGDRITRSSTVLTSVAAEVYSGKMSPAAPRWQNVVSDTAYMALLLRLQLQRHVRLVTRHMPKGMLRDVYETRGIWGSDVHPVHTDHGVLWYASFVYSEEPDDAPTLRDAQRVAVTDMSGLLAGK